MKKQEISKTVLKLVDVLSVIGMIGTGFGMLASFMFSPIGALIGGGFVELVLLAVILATSTIEDYLTHIETQTLLLEKIANNFADDKIS